MEATGISLTWLMAAAIAVGAILFLIVVVAVIIGLFNKPRRKADARPKPLFDFAAAPPLPPDVSQPHLEIYGTPVRALFVLLAPVGRASQLPLDGEHQQIFNSIDPQLAAVLSRDAPQFEIWPAQLSAAGFCQAFFNQTAMPGNGKGTPWCAVAGKVDALGSPILVGMIFVAASPNALGEIRVEHEGKWRDILRVVKAK